MVIRSEWPAVVIEERHDQQGVGSWNSHILLYSFLLEVYPWLYCACINLRVARNNALLSESKMCKGLLVVVHSP